MTTDGTPKDDVKVPEGEVGDLIQKAFDDGQDVRTSSLPPSCCWHAGTGEARY